MSELRVIYGTGLPKEVRDHINRELRLVDTRPDLEAHAFAQHRVVHSLDLDDEVNDNECSELRLGYDRYQRKRRQ